MRAFHHLARPLLASGASFLVWLITATPAAAHGGATGAQDVVQDYGVFIFLAAVVLIGAGVVVWVLRAPPPGPEAQDTPEAGAARR
ncbi:MAG: hypothetical protein HY332_18140 [Chloroflexi bacterium]|nr:hypothetical protein [Chloroflexota bacterium]